MNRSTFAHTSLLRRAAFDLGFLTLIVAMLFGTKLPFKIQAQQFAGDSILGGSATSVGALSAADKTFLQLAESVGQTASAQRLIDYKLANDPTRQERYWAIVDFNQPSTSKRLYVFDTVGKRIESYYVSHGRGSEGSRDDGIADVFSNLAGSNSSSLGIYRTLNDYVGSHGRALRLEGLEPTNSNAFSRAVVLHTANYVSDAFIRQTGRLGRSEGCFAVERSVGDTLIDELKDGAYIIASKY